MRSPAYLDPVDRRILELLAENARRTTADIARHVCLTPAPVKRRLARLERLGVIAGYTVQIDHSKIGPTIEAFTELRITGDADVDRLAAEVSLLPEVREVLTIAGDPDLLVRTRVESVEHLKRMVNELRRTGRVTGTKTLMVLDREGDGTTDRARP
jgi:Lrp/AsnC family leucine-responsive transcriptional regulator